MLESLIIDDYVVHPGTYSMVTDVKGLGLPSPRSSIFERANRHGAVDHTRYHQGRILSIEGVVWGDDSVSPWDTFDELKEHFALSSLPEKILTFRLKGRVDEMLAKVKIASPIDDSMAPGHIRWAVTLFSADPRIYGAVLRSSQYNPAGSVSNGGVAMPLDFPLQFSNTGLSGFLVVNGGQFASPPILKIHGPVSNPIVYNISTGQSIQIVASLGASDEVVIDVVNRTVLLNGSSRPDIFSASSSWWELQPGTNSLQLSGSGMSGGSNEISNSSFETDTSGWSVGDGTTSIARVTAQFKYGAASCEYTADGTDPHSAANSPQGDVTPGGQVAAGVWMRPDDVDSVTGEVVLNWTDSSFAFISSITSGTVTLPAAAWTYVELLGTAPSNAVHAYITPYFRTAGSNYTATDKAGQIDGAVIEDLGATLLSVQYRDARI